MTNPGPAGSQEQYGYNPDRVAVRDAGLRVVHSEQEHAKLKQPDGSYVKGVSQVYVVGEYPKVVYKAAAKGQSGYIEKVVSNADEQAAAKKAGFATSTAEIHALLDSILRGESAVEEAPEESKAKTPAKK